MWFHRILLFLYPHMFESSRALFAPASTREGYRSDIEGLRGVSVLLVVLYHMGFSAFEGGFIGVDVFFVLSGYLITGIIARRVEEGRGLGIVDFYARRVRRLLPASLVVLTAVCLAIPLVYSPSKQLLFESTARATAFYFSNHWLFAEAGDYFGASAEFNPFLHTWSLAVEEQFYLVWPLLLWLAYQGVSGGRRRARYILGVVGALSYGLSVWCTWRDPAAAFYWMPLRAWEFAVGGLLVLRPGDSTRTIDASGTRLGYLGLILVLVASMVVQAERLFPGVTGLLPVIGTLAVLVAGEARGRKGVGALLDFWPFQVLGRLSYSWYLWHWPALRISERVIPYNPPLSLSAAIAGSLLLSVLTFLLVEYPVRHNKWLGARPRTTLLFAAMATIMAGFFVSSWATRDKDIAAYQDLRTMTEELPAVYGTGCQVHRDKAEPIECRRVEGAGAVVAVIGDSHAAHWLPGLEPVAEALGWRLLAHYKPACPLAMVDTWHPGRGKGSVFGKCAEWRLDLIEEMKEVRPDVIIIAHATRAYPSQSISPEVWEQGFRKMLVELTTASSRVVLFADVERSRIKVGDCLASAQWKSLSFSSCDFEPGFPAGSDELDAAEQRAIMSVPGAFYISFNDLLCPDGRCRAFDNGVVHYRDWDHLTPTYTRSLAPHIQKRLLEVIQAPVNPAR